MRLPLLLIAIGLGCSSCTITPPLKKPLPPGVALSSPVFARELTAAVSADLTVGNRIETLENGREIFPAMLAAIRSAKRTVNFETYVYWRGRVPEQFADALEAAGRRGVEVNVILDAVGANKAGIYRRRLEDAGVNVELYHPLLWLDPRRATYRTHRKLLIVDGRVGFIGGVGIADEWDGDARNPDEWRDLHYRVEGPVVRQLQSAFMENWQKLRAELVRGPDNFPSLPSAGSIKAAAITSAPRQNRCTVEVLYHEILVSARKSVRIVSPYFLPDDNLVEAMCQASRRGVKVEVIMAGEHTDAPSVRRASRKRWPELLKAGVILHEYAPTMNHTKLLVADDSFVSLGSANFDPRSLRINDEANMVVFDPAFARSQVAIFQKDLKRCRRITPKDAGMKVTELPLSMAQMPVESQL